MADAIWFGLTSLLLIAAALWHFIGQWRLARFWQDQARQLHCPQCGTCFTRWDGQPLTLRDGELPRGAVLTCPQCGHRAAFVRVSPTAAKPYDPRDDEKAPEPPRCKGCGYLLYGNTSGRCPECGVPTPPPPEAPPEAPPKVSP